MKQAFEVNKSLTGLSCMIDNSVAAQKLTCSAIYQYSSPNQLDTNHMIPIVLRLGDEKNYSVAVLWFPATRNFIKMLPASARSRIEGFYSEPAVPVSLAEAYGGLWQSGGEGTESNPKIRESAMADFAGISVMELSDKELENINIIKKDSIYETYVEQRYNFDQIPDEEARRQIKIALASFGYDTTKPGIVRTPLYLDKKGQNSPDAGIKYTGWDMIHGNPLCPVVIQTEWFRYEYNYSSKKYDPAKSSTTTIISGSPMLDGTSKDIYDWDKNVPKINRLLPVKITFNSAPEADSAGFYRTDIFLWLYISRESAEKLPERYREPILKELDMISGVEDGAITLEDACKGAGSNFFGLCRLSSGSLMLLGTCPNPAVEELSANFRLDAPRRLTFRMFGQNGSEIVKLARTEDCRAGTGKIKLTGLGTLSPGVYIFSIESDKGEKVSGKVLVGR